MDGPSDQRPVWRNPVMWLVVGLPAASMVAGIGLVVVASRQGSDAVPDRVRRTAQIQVADLGPDELARQQRLSAVLRVGTDSLELLPVNGELGRGRPLTLRLMHPAREQDDVVLTLAPTATGWSAAHALDAGHDWKVQLTPADGHWRITGRLPKGQRAVLLQPSLREQP